MPVIPVNQAEPALEMQPAGQVGAASGSASMLAAIVKGVPVSSAKAALMGASPVRDAAGALRAGSRAVLRSAAKNTVALRSARNAYSSDTTGAATGGTVGGGAGSFLAQPAPSSRTGSSNSEKKRGDARE